MLVCSDYHSILPSFLKSLTVHLTSWFEAHSFFRNSEHIRHSIPYGSSNYIPFIPLLLNCIFVFPRILGHQGGISSIKMSGMDLLKCRRNYFGGKERNSSWSLKPIGLLNHVTPKGNL